MSEVSEPTAKQPLLTKVMLAIYRKLDLVGDQRLLIGEGGPPVRNAPPPLAALGRFIKTRLAAKKHSSPPESSELFQQKVNATVQTLGDVVSSYQEFTVRPNTEDWLGTGIQAAQNDEFTLLANGMLYILKALDVGIGPAVGLWYRFGDGEVHKLTRTAQVIRADVAGELQLIGAIPGEFGDPSGQFETSVPRKPMQGEYSVAVIAWGLSTQHGLTAAVRENAALFKPALEDYEAPVKAPDGWAYLWKIGQGEVFRSCEHDGEQAICCHANQDVGILQYPLDVALTPETRFKWSWLMERLPSALPEHIQPTHDYLSIAIEFENGLDLTYMWSAELPVDTIFQCPLPWWDQRETHWVLRNDPGEMGKWLDEDRNVYKDYQQAISGPMPQRVVAVWLIANAAFQRGQGDCRYRSIAVGTDDQTIQVRS